MKFADLTLILAATMNALMAGLFFSYSISVCRGLGKLDDLEFLKAMQHINREIQNPIFFACFFGALIMLPITTIQQYSQNQNSFALLFIATLVYLTGVFGVTAFANVPLNNKLGLFDLSTATGTIAKQMRNSFEIRWNYWNNVRTVASLSSLVFVILACIFNKTK